jgi:hypothetical protein
MISAREEAARVAEFEDRYELVESQVAELIEARRAVGGKNEATPGYINKGSVAATFKICANGLELAVRLNRYTSNLVPYIAGRAVAMARSKGVECTEQGYAMNVAKGIMVSHYINAEPHNKRGERGGLWLFASDVAKLVQAQDKCVTLNVQREHGSFDNLLSGPGGLTFVDMLPTNIRSYFAEENLIPELLYSFSRTKLKPPFDPQQEQELRAIVSIFKKRYPNSSFLAFAHQVVRDYKMRLASEPSS